MLRRLGPLLIALLIVISMTGAAAALDATWPGLYYRVVQEDGALEWATFWSFLAARPRPVSGEGCSAGWLSP